MSSEAIEVGEEALEKKLNAMKIGDENTAEEEIVDGDDKPNKRLRRPRLTDEERRKQWEDIQKTKEVVSAGLKGTVKWYSILGHYGFIARENEEGDIFVHQSAIAKSKTEKFYLRTLADGEEVEFDIVQGKKGLEAANVTGPEGAEVRGARAFRILLRRWRRSINRDDNKPVDGEVVEKKSAKRRPHKKEKEPQGENEIEKIEEGQDQKPKHKKRNRKNRTKNAKRDPEAEIKGEGKEVEESTETGGARRRAESTSSNTEPSAEICSSSIPEDRCGSSIGASGDASLGAAAVDGQI